MKRKIIAIQVTIFFLLALFNVAFAEQGKGEKGRASSEKMKTFIVHSYEEDHVCGGPQGRGITETLEKEFKDRIQIRTHFMNTKTVNSAPDKMKEEAILVLREVEKFKADVVFTLDDDAFREVGLKLNGKSYPVIFSGMNGQPEDYSKDTPFLDSKGRPSSNITGVYEKLHFQTALNVMRVVIPDLKKIVALLDMTPTSYAIRVQLEKELIGYPEKVEVVFKHVGTMKGYLQAISEINNDPSVQAVYPVVLSVADDTGKSVGFRTTLRAYIENCKKPGMALNFDFARLGLFGGASVDFSSMGRQAGIMGSKLLKGTRIQEIPIESAEKYLITFNKEAADRLKIKIPDDLIAAAIIYNSIALLAHAK
jgi:ABC-type uncharacterized transport system substrate-binding protein